MDKKRVTLRKRIVCQALEKRGDEIQGTVCEKDGMGIHLSHEGMGFMSYDAYSIGAELTVTVRRNPHDKCPHGLAKRERAFEAKAPERSQFFFRAEASNTF